MECDKNKDLENQITALETERDALLSENTQLKTDIADTKALNDTLTQENSDLLAKLTNIQDELNQ